DGSIIILCRWRQDREDLLRCARRRRIGEVDKDGRDANVASALLAIHDTGEAKPKVAELRWKPTLGDRVSWRSRRWVCRAGVAATAARSTRERCGQREGWSHSARHT